jgi:queuosine precursor transporter
MTRSYLPGIIAMAAIVVASNILVQFLLGDYLTWGALTYPLAFLVNDLMNRLYGPAAARRVVWAGFATGVACSLVGTQIVGEFGPLVTLRIAIGSGLAFLTAQMLDIAIFDRLRDRRWWKAPLASTLVGSTVDTALFFSIAFAAGFRLPRAGQRRELGQRDRAAAGLGHGRALLGEHGGRRLDGQTGAGAACPGAISHDREEKDATGRIKPFDKHKICATLCLVST